MNKNINVNLLQTKEELASKIDNLESKQDDKVKELTDKVTSI